MTRLATPSWRERIGRAALFAYALHASIFLSFSVSFVDAGGRAFGLVMTAAFIWPALVVLWGFWRAHSVIGWSVCGLWGGMMLFASFHALVYPGATTHNPAPLTPFFPFYALGLSLWLAPSTLLLGIMFWAWDRQLPLPLLEKEQPEPKPALRSTRLRTFLLGANGSLMSLGVGMLLLILYLEHAAGQGLGGHMITFWPLLGTLTAAQNLQSDLMAFHVLSLTMLAVMLWISVWCYRSDVAEAGGWLLLPGQIITMAWTTGYPFLKAGTLTLMFLFFLVHWYHGTPATLRHNRRAKWHWTTGHTPETRQKEQGPALP